MEILISSSNDIFTTTLDTVGKTLTLSGVNNFPLDVYSPREIYDVTHAGYIGLPNLNEFAWFRSNGLPIFVWGVNNLPAGASNGDTLNFLLDIGEYQSGLSLAQKIASASAGTPGTLVTGETPSGTINGTNKVFTLANTTITGAVMLSYTPLNGARQFLIYGVDFTMAAAVATLNVAPITGSSLIALYYH